MLDRRCFLATLGSLATVAGLAQTDAGEDWDGVDDAAGEAVMSAARQRIEQIRKSDVMLVCVDQAGNPIDGQATARLVRHKFLFGAAMSDTLNLKDDHPAKQPALDAASELFNAATCNCHWAPTQPTIDTFEWGRTDSYLAWADQHGLAPRMHALIYINTGFTPRWRGEIPSTDAWWPQIERRIAAVAERYGDRYIEYDVINEAHFWADFKREQVPLFPNLLDPDVAVRIFQIASQYLPDQPLMPLHQFIPTTFADNSMFLEYFDWCRTLIDRGAPLNAIGYQGHFYTQRDSFSQGQWVSGPDAFRMKELDAGLGKLASLGQPVHITEFNPPSRNRDTPKGKARLTDEAVARWSDNFYTLAFSKPYVREITRWFVIDTVGGRGVDAGLVDLQGNLKPNYHALKKLLQESWSTRWQGALANGKGSFRGFHGTYELTLPGRPAATFDLPEGGGEVQLVVG